MKLNEILGLTSYVWYGGGYNDGSWTQPDTIQGYDLLTAGKKVSSVSAVYPFKLQRFFVDNWIVCNATVPVQLMVEPSPQKFWFDSYFKLCKANGIKTEWGMAGLFNWQLGCTTSQRKTSIPCNSDPLNPATWADHAELARQIAEHYKGTGLLDCISFMNEWNFKWNVHRVMTPVEYSVAFKCFYDAVRSVNTEIQLSMGGSIGRDINEVETFISSLKQLYNAENKAMPTDWIIDQHWYMRDGSANQGGGTTGITPEDAKAYEYGLQLDAICERDGIFGWKIGESGWATDNSKQHAPDLEGMTRLEAQGHLMVRTALILSACKYFKGIEFWHCRDLYDAEPYAYGGVNNKDWSPKPAFHICNDFLQKYGNEEVESYSFQNNLSSVKLKSGKHLSWSNKVNSGNLTPIPSEVIIQMPKHLEVKNNKLHFDGQPFYLIEGNSPETRLRDLHYPELDELNSYGVNCLMATLFGGDITTIHPFKDRSNPSLGFDDAKVDLWVAYFRKWVFGYPGKKHVLHLLLSEKENHYELSESDHKKMLDYFVAKFQEFDGYIIWNREELDVGKQSYINTYYSYLKQINPNNIRGMHNNTNEDPWNGFENSDLVQLLALQEWEGNFDRRIKELTAKNPNWCAYVSEVTGGFQPTDTAKVQTLFNAGGGLSSGISFFISSKDHAFPDFQSQYKDLYLTANNLSNGVVNPPPPPQGGNMIIGYSSKADRSDFIEIGQNIPVGSYYVEARNVVAPVVFSLKKDGVIIHTKTENGAPFDLYGGQIGSFAQGVYELAVTDKANLPKVITFNVGSVQPPPPNPEPRKIQASIIVDEVTYSGELVEKI